MAGEWEGSIQIEGGPELRRALRALNADLRDLSALHREIARDVVAAVSSTAPRGTEEKKRKTQRLATSFRANATRTTAKAKSSLIYAPVINFGWGKHNIEPQHYAEAALSKAHDGIEAKYRRGISQLLRRAES